MEIRDLIDELEKLTERGMHVPGGRVLLDEGTLHQIIGDMRVALQEEGRTPHRGIQERDRILNEARLQARRIVEDAQAHANTRLEEQNAVQLARERARQIVVEAEQNAAHMRTDANTYVANQLSALESRLQRVLHEVQSGQRFLSQPAPPPPPATEKGADKPG